MSFVFFKISKIKKSNREKEIRFQLIQIEKQTFNSLAQEELMEY